MEFLKSVDWKGVAIPALFYILGIVLAVGVVPQLYRLPELTKKLFDWVYAKSGEAKNTYVAGLLQRLSIIVRDAVLHVENTAIEDLKEKARDGKITKEELLDALKKVKADCVDMIKNHIQLQGLFDLVVSLIFGDEAKLLKWVADHIETQVATLPPSGLQTVPTSTALAAAEAGIPFSPAVTGLKKSEPAPVTPPKAVG